jgi:hypothetical protein
MGDGKNTKEDMYDPILAYTHAYTVKTYGYLCTT